VLLHRQIQKDGIRERAIADLGLDDDGAAACDRQTRRSVASYRCGRADI